MAGDRHVAAWLRGWAEASEAVERVPTESCLTSEEIAAFLDDTLEHEPRERAALHFARCSFCTREAGAVYRAAREFDDRLRVRRALGSAAARVGACLRVFVDEARGAFTRLDAVLRGLGPSAALTSVPALATAGGALRGGTSVLETDVDPEGEALYEVMLQSEAVPGAEILCSEEEDGGSVVVSLAEPEEVCLLHEDGSLWPGSVESVGDRYYATFTGIPPGSYFLTIMRPEAEGPLPPAPPSPPSA